MDRGFQVEKSIQELFDLYKLHKFKGADIAAQLKTECLAFLDEPRAIGANELHSHQMNLLEGIGETKVKDFLF
jgi:hypothetical protein